MTPQVWRERMVTVIRDGQECDCPVSETEGERVVSKGNCGRKWWAQLSASGYMDRTDTAGPFDTEREALEYLAETYADDIDDCEECNVEE